MHEKMREKMRNRQPTGYDKKAGKQLDARKRAHETLAKKQGRTPPGSMKRKAL